MPAAKPPTRTSGRDPNRSASQPTSRPATAPAGAARVNIQGYRTVAQAQIVVHRDYEKGVAVTHGAAEYRQQGTNGENPPAVEDTT